jgi:hypothetical protein
VPRGALAMNTSSASIGPLPARRRGYKWKQFLVRVTTDDWASGLPDAKKRQHPRWLCWTLMAVTR